MENTLPDCQDLPPTERAECYRAYAEQARSYSERAVTAEIRAGFLKMADDWLKLADDLDAHYGKISVSVSSELALILDNQPSRD